MQFHFVYDTKLPKDVHRAVACRSLSSPILFLIPSVILGVIILLHIGIEINQGSAGHNFLTIKQRTPLKGRDIQIGFH